MIKTSIRFFDDIPVRAVWAEESSKWCFCAVDVVEALAISEAPKEYWKTLKRENPQLSAICRQLKLPARDGGSYLADVVDDDGVKTLLAMLPSRKPTAKADEYLYVGVSPKGYYGCNYWYVDEEKQTRANTYVWVTMGRRNIEQIVYVDSVRCCTADNLPYPIEKTKRVLRQTTEEERKEAEAFWNT